MVFEFETPFLFLSRQQFITESHVFKVDALIAPRHCDFLLVSIESAVSDKSEVQVKTASVNFYDRDAELPLFLIQSEAQTVHDFMVFLNLV